MSTAKGVAGAFREVVQDLLVPELKAVKVSVESLHTEMSFLRTEMKLRDEKMEQLVSSNDKRLEQKIDLNHDKLEQTMKSNHDRLEQIIHANDEKQTELQRSEGERTQQLLRNLSEKLDFAIDIRERLATLEARLPRQ